MTLTHLTRPARGEPEGLLVLLHGRGADEHDLFPLLDVLDPERRLLGVTPRAPLALRRRRALVRVLPARLSRTGDVLGGVPARRRVARRARRPSVRHHATLREPLRSPSARARTRDRRATRRRARTPPRTSPVRDSRAGRTRTSAHRRGGSVERRARRHAEQPALRIEHVEQRKEIVLVRAATVEEDEQPFGLTTCRPCEMGERH